jgi:hypothetical protein
MISEGKRKIESSIAKLIEVPIESETSILIERFETLLGFKHDTQEFNWLISAIRRGLYQYGLYLSGEGSSQSGSYQIYHSRDNQWVAKLRMARHERDLEGMQTLLVNTDLNKLSDLEKSRHENTLREVSLKLSLMRRSSDIEKMLKKHGKHLQKTSLEEID